MEEATLALLRTDPEKTLTMLFKQHKPSCIAFMKSMYTDEAEIDYIFTEALLILYDYSRRPDFTLNCKIQTFLKAICRNQIRARKNKERKRHDNLGDKKDEFLDNLPDSRDEGQHEINEQADQAEQAIKDMQVNTPKCYEILKRYYYYGHNMNKIANDLGYSNADSVKNQKARCFKKFEVAFFKRSNSEQHKPKKD